MFNITEKLNEVAQSILSRFDVVAFPNDKENNDNVPREATVEEVADVIREHLPFWGDRPFQCGLLFGEVHIQIPGYEIIQKPKEWLIAVAPDGQRYYVVRTPHGWLLHAARFEGELRRWSPEAAFMDTLAPIYIPR